MERAMKNIACATCGAKLVHPKRGGPRTFCVDCSADRRAERQRAYSRRYYWKNREKCMEEQRDWYVKERKHNAAWRAKNKRRAKAWRKKNADHVREYERAR